MKLVYAISTAVLIVYAAEISAQNKSVPVYVKVYGSYGFLSPGSFKGEPPKSRSSLDTTIFRTGKTGFGEGIRVGAGFGFILNDYINAGLDVEYLKGKKLETTATETIGKQVVNSTSVFNHSLLSVIPNITFKAVSKPSYHIYTRLGIIIGVPLMMTEDYNFESFERTLINPNPWTLSIKYNAEYDLKTGFGYQAVLGAQIKITDNLRGLVEIAGYRLSLNRITFEEKEKVKTYISRLAQWPDPPDISRNIIQYKNEGSLISTSPQNNVYTFTRPQEPVNMNAITVNIGIFYRF